MQKSGFVKRDKDLCFQRPREWSILASNPCCKSHQEEEHTTMYSVSLHTGKRQQPLLDGRARNGEDEREQRQVDTKKMASPGPPP